MLRRETDTLLAQIQAGLFKWRSLMLSRAQSILTGGPDNALFHSWSDVDPQDISQ